ncbi:translesion error-prone DNA polymerase V autoproteolytic subunit [Halomonas alkaliantarctica]|uniref:Translesion error-prone DNA polymerase V autoproteolytic subunit n=1 Tax=Halomonas alkaliantarctica TaxID=232346 RepID=A0ABY8LRY2_9GAMM|nr:translesion error-prone DNA polymerase V autoproteolytic subunit [Halomonas alkaliantarctica]WGI26616.1 translesion error-prone DNA polymerase V autoproteolytic subunit [Halomonas alkaliantarctica]
MPGQSVHFIPALPLSSQPLPYLTVTGRAGFSGFPSPAQDYEPRTLDLNTRLVKNPTETFYVTATGDSMEGWGIFDGDLLIVDRGIKPRLGHMLVAMLEGEVLIKRYSLYKESPHLCSAHPAYPPLPLEGSDCQLWGVVRAVVHEYLR